MKLDFFGFDPSYRFTRYNFIWRVPKSRTPSYLAAHRSTQPCPTSQKNNTAIVAKNSSMPQGLTGARPDSREPAC